MSSSQKHYNDNIQTAFAQNNSKVNIQPSNGDISSQNISKKKLKGSNSKHYRH